MRELSEAEKVVQRGSSKPKSNAWLIGSVIWGLGAILGIPADKLFVHGWLVVYLSSFTCYMIGAFWNDIREIGPLRLSHRVLGLVRLMLGRRTCRWCGVGVPSNQFETHRCTTMLALDRLQTIMAGS